MRDLSIATGDSRQAKKWINRSISYEDLNKRLSNTIRTSESVTEYAGMSGNDRNSAKDHGGFVGGKLKDGSRKLESVEYRSMIALDGDQISKEFLDEYEERSPFTSCLYTTHSSTEDNPRVRIIFPLVRDVTTEEFVAISRYLANMLGIDQFDECSYQPNQLMYWPSTPQDGVFIFRKVEKDWLNPDTFLAAHPDWNDPANLPHSSRETNADKVRTKKVQDPLTKNGIIGLFNRTYYPVTTAIEKFLSDVYEPTDNPNRWQLKGSASVAGVEIKDDKFVYSHHATDPAYLKLCNAFDIVRIHKFGGKDEVQAYKAMCDFALEQDEVKMKSFEERKAEAATDFSAENDGGEEDNSWKTKLTLDKNGRAENTLRNLRLIMENDKYLKNIVFNQLADGMEIAGEVPWEHPSRFWRDADDAQLICYTDQEYGTFSQRNYNIAVTKCVDDRSYHPIKDYFNALPAWDGVKRVETLIVDYLGAEDNPYVRAVTRKALCAAYIRIYNPGTKFDYITVLNGDQGIGKSTFISHLGMEWFSDSLSISDMNDKTAAEKLQGYWIHEIGEMAGMKKADLEKVKAFVSRQDDKYRASFGHRVTPHPRQCIFFGTTNSENGYLRDITGNRRYWNVKVSGKGRFTPWEMTQELVDQVWAEVRLIAEAGESLFLPHELEEYAKQEQADAMERDDREGLVQEYLSMLLPANWDDMDIPQRREYIRDNNDPLRPKGVRERDEVSNLEIWCECFGKQKEDIKPADSYQISAIMVRMKNWERTSERKRLPLYGQQRLYKRRY